MTPDTRTTENPELSSAPLTEAGRRVHNARHKGSCPAEYGEECWTLTDVLDIEAEAAQGAAPRMAEPPYCLLDERGGCIDPRFCEHKPQGTAPRAEGTGERFVEQVVGEPGMYDDEADERPLAAPRAEGLDVRSVLDRLVAANEGLELNGIEDEYARLDAQR